MSILLGGRGSVLKESIPYHPYDPKIEVLGDVKGKSEKTKILKLDLRDTMLFPQMNIDMFYEMEYGMT
jgi:hypothetical protein